MTAPPDRDAGSGEGADHLARRQAEALGHMMAADSRRIDSLVGDVGVIRGDVSGLRGDVGRVGAGVDELRGALTVLTRHQVTMETLVTDNRTIRDAVSRNDLRLQQLEQEMPGLREARSWGVRAVQGVLAVVGLALLGLIFVKGGP